MKLDVLGLLSAHDLMLLERLMKPVAYEPGETVLHEGVTRRALLFVREGAVRVERSDKGRPITLAQLGAGEILGELGFVEDAPASASVVAQERAVLDVIEGDAVQSLMASEPGFAVRFYHSLAVVMAQRVRSTSRRLAAAGTGEVAQVNRFRVPRTGNISSRQMPEGLALGLDEFEATMLAVKQALRAGTSQDAQAARVATACDSVLELLDRFTRDITLVDMGYNDLLSFRDTSHLEAGVGDYIFRETFPVFMLSATMARCYAKPRGFPDDWETMEVIYADRPEGDDRLGPLIDRWFLRRPICCSRRTTRDEIRATLGRLSVERTGGQPIRFASLASGAAAEAFGFCQDTPLVFATCVDLDEEALLRATARAERLGLVDRMTFIHASAVPADGNDVSMLRQEIIAAVGLCEYLDDEQVVGLLNRAFDTLLPGGALVITALATAHPDQALMEHLLDWKTYDRTSTELEALIARSRFGPQPAQIWLDATGVTLIALCRRRL